MAYPAYSYRIWMGAIASGANFRTANVPAGNVLVVRSLTFTQTPGANNYVRIQISPGAIVVFQASTAAPSNSLAMDPHWVLHQGDSMLITAFGAQVSIALSGYLLVGSQAPLNPTTIVRADGVVTPVFDDR